MPWAMHEPLPFEKRLEWVRTQRGHFDLGADYCYGVFLKDSGLLIGVCLLRMTMEPNERDIGYWIHAEHLRRGYAFEAACALVRLGFDLEALESVLLRTLPENAASCRIAEKLGFLGPELDPLSFPTAEGDKRDTWVFHLPRVVYAQSQARSFELRAFDVLDREIPMAIHRR